MFDNTIFALATAQGKSGVAVIRVSGLNATKVFDKLCDLTFGNKDNVKPRYANMIKIKDIETNELIDKAMAIYFAAPNSYTGEDVVEIHTHGSMAVIDAVIENLSKIEGFKIAEPGEFTRRAFENKKMDLTAAEAVADLIEAETKAQRNQALRQMQGELKDIYDNWRSVLVKELAHLEAFIDFPEEELPDSIITSVESNISLVINGLVAHLDDNRRGEKLRNGYQIAILGKPNAGKSSLLNKIAKKDIAIVSKTAGTTRDIVQAHLDIGGFPVIISDTAGLRETEEEIESEGIKRAYDKASQSDLVIYVIDGSECCSNYKIENIKSENIIYVFNKIDICNDKTLPDDIDSNKLIHVSVKEEDGLDNLFEKISKQVKEGMAFGETAAITRLRHRISLKHCLDSLKRFNIYSDIELAAEDLRLAVRSLGKITGRVEVEELLDIIFGEFCIGK